MNVYTNTLYTTSITHTLITVYFMQITHIWAQYIHIFYRSDTHNKDQFQIKGEVQ